MCLDALYKVCNELSTLLILLSLEKRHFQNVSFSRINVRINVHLTLTNDSVHIDIAASFFSDLSTSFFYFHNVSISTDNLKGKRNRFTFIQMCFEMLYCICNEFPIKLKPAIDAVIEP